MRDGRHYPLVIPYWLASAAKLLGQSPLDKSQPVITRLSTPPRELPEDRARGELPMERRKWEALIGAQPGNRPWTLVHPTAYDGTSVTPADVRAYQSKIRLSANDTERMAVFEEHGEASVHRAVALVDAMRPEQFADLRSLQSLICNVGMNDEMSYTFPIEFAPCYGRGLHVYQYPNQLSRYLAWLANEAAQPRANISSCETVAEPRASSQRGPPSSSRRTCYCCCIASNLGRIRESHSTTLRCSCTRLLTQQLLLIKSHPTLFSSDFEIGCRWGGNFIVVVEVLRRHAPNLRWVGAVDPIGETPMMRGATVEAARTPAALSPYLSRPHSVTLTLSPGLLQRTPSSSPPRASATNSSRPSQQTRTLARP